MKILREPIILLENTEFCVMLTMLFSITVGTFGNSMTMTGNAHYDKGRMLFLMINFKNAQIYLFGQKYYRHFRNWGRSPSNSVG